jgi:hypothetical protein
MTAALTALQLNPRMQNGQIRFGFTGEYINPTTGQSQLAPSRDANEIKRAYSAEVIKSQAKRNGWTLKQTGPFAYEAMKR